MFANKGKINQSSKVQISVSCQGLRKCDVGSKSDPFCTFEQYDGKSWKETGRTDYQKDTSDPNWGICFLGEYFFEMRQKIAFSVHDHDGNKSQLIGRIECLMSDLVRGSVVKQLEHESHKNNGTIKISAETVSNSNDTFTFQFSVPKDNKLPRMDMIGGCDPYFQMCRQNEDGSFTMVYTSKVIDNTRHPTWPEEKEYSVSKLTNGDLGRKIQVRVFDSDGSKHDLEKDDYIGCFEFTLSELRGGRTSRDYPIIYDPDQDPKKKKAHKKVKEVARMHLEGEVRQRASFTDYLREGLEINCMVAVDFTGSNGSVNDPSSLHYYKSGSETQYEQGIRGIAEVLSDYDTDGKIYASGYGAKIGSNPTSHHFPLNGDPKDPEVKGPKGVLDSYRHFLNQLDRSEAIMSGPTYMNETIQTANAMAQHRYGNKLGASYSVLLIFTDGVINDVKEVKRTLVQSSTSPLSVVILGIGEADFSAMEELDGDDGLLRDDSGKAVSRDIVNFVAVNDFPGNITKLCQAVLAEIPGQIVQYMTMYNITPESLRR